MKHIKLFEDISMGDPTYANDIFRVKYKAVNDLSNKKAPDSIDKPVNDVLDGIEEGDVVIGIGIEDDKEHTGNVVRILKDEKGENTKISIEEDGDVIELAPGSVKFADAGDKGNQGSPKGASVDTGNSEYSIGSYDSAQPATYENVHIKSFNNFI